MELCEINLGQLFLIFITIAINGGTLAPLNQAIAVIVIIKEKYSFEYSGVYWRDKMKNVVVVPRNSKYNPISLF